MSTWFLHVRFSSVSMLGDLGMRMFDRNIYYLRKAEKVDYYAFALLHLNII